MTTRIVKSITDEAGLRRVDIIQRADGRFSFQEWYFSDDPEEQCWLAAPQQMTTLTDTSEAAEREARARVDWLS